MPELTIDLNSDLGEGCGADADILPLITTANVACGFHAGDPATAFTTLRLAVRHGVRIGAHIGGDWSDVFQIMTRAQRRIRDCRFTVDSHLLAFCNEMPVHQARVELRPVLAAAAVAAHRNRFPQLVRGLQEPAAARKSVRGIGSSHLYDDRTRFFAEAFRVLRPGGHFLYTDGCWADDDCSEDLLAAGFDLLERREITTNVLRALRRDSRRREAIFDALEDRQIWRVWY